MAQNSDGETWQAGNWTVTTDSVSLISLWKQKGKKKNTHTNQQVTLEETLKKKYISIFVIKMGKTKGLEKARI